MAAAPTGAACDDGDPCTAGEHCSAASCVAGGPRLWTSYFGKGQGGRVSGLAARGDGGFQTAGNADFDPVTGYDAWTVHVDATGKLANQETYVGTGSGDLVAVTTVPGSSGQAFVLVGSSAGRGYVVRRGPATTVWQNVYGTAQSRLEAVAVGADGTIVAGGLGSIGNKVSTGWLQGIDPSGQAKWAWGQTIPGKMVAVTQVVALPSGFAALGYDRTLTAAGADLYDVWARFFDPAGQELKQVALLQGKTAAASGLLARPDGSLVALVDDGSAGQVRLWTIAPTGQATVLAQLPGGDIQTPTDLLAGPGGTLHVVRDTIQGPVQVVRLGPTGTIEAAHVLTWPNYLKPRVFSALWLGGDSLALAGDVFLQTTASSSTTFRSFVRRVDVFDPPACSQTEACLGDTHGCQPAGKCLVPLCDGQSGCGMAQVPAAACKP